MKELILGEENILPAQGEEREPANPFQKEQGNCSLHHKKKVQAQQSALSR
ncbi:MAG: hypothetical protein GF350_09510 [Chitinivibrionales bacterium]|nr:hypothetical protein [Chitinivibrionales bacterium]